MERRIQKVKDNVKQILYEVEETCVKSAKDPRDITIAAVTKTVEPILVNAALEEGIRVIGENRVQEYLSKKGQYHLDGIEKHFIGHLQTNKVKQIVADVDTIQTVDSLKLAKEIDKHCKVIGKVMNVLVQVNISREESKSGVYAEELEELLWGIKELQHIQVQGLMTIPAFGCTKKENFSALQQMYQLFVDIKAKNVDNMNIRTLSMGMSGDFLDAIQAGANLVRIGSAIFGERND